MKILVVEDSVKLNEGIQLYLEEEGFNVEVAFNGVQALSKVKDLQKEGEEFDVIILDRMMPMKDGIETLREIKNLGIESGIIILTAKDTVDDKVFGLAAGADDYMVKPFNVKELTARIHSLYRRNLQKNNPVKNANTHIVGTTVKKEVFHADKDSRFTFNANTGEIVIEKEEGKEKTISLTNKEADIFEILLEENGGAVSKENILEKIWKESETPSSRFVDVHVHNLRNKLIKNNFSGKVETVRGVGYKLVFN
ncbi:Response regulator ArlR [bioreactor metagenome]|uniref:Response regulator ArlR n=1 Tax=bioreactor metagenome TaxID=1076179 RepID=A0A644T8D1_9ZZZZ|nr:response regulator transcription factor [Candidatus Elulimicrobiales bacterium]